MVFLPQKSLLMQIRLARLHLGIFVALPYLLVGFYVNWALTIINNPTIAQLNYSLIFFRLLLAYFIALLMGPFIMIINNYFDAPYDAFDAKKSQQNPFCVKKIHNILYIQLLLGIFALLILLASFLISWYIGLLTIIILLFGIFYSTPPIRFKTIPLIDFLIHGISLGVFFFTLGYFSFSTGHFNGSNDLIFIFFLIYFMLDASWIHLVSALKDYDVDKATLQRTTPVVVGQRSTLYLLILMTFLLITIFPLIFTLNYDYITTFGKSLANVIMSIFLIMTLSFIYGLIKLKGNIENTRLFCARYRVYMVYSFVISVLVTINPVFGL